MVYDQSLEHESDVESTFGVKADVEVEEVIL